MRKYYIFILVVLCAVSFSFGQAISPTYPAIKVKMRDAFELSVDVYVPDTTRKYPVILIQTPYWKNLMRLKGLPLVAQQDISKSNYAFVVADWRCFYGSLKLADCTKNITGKQRGEDGYDLIEWITQQQWSDGKVGTWGPSALGKVQYWTAREQPPGLKCAVPLVAGSQTTFEEYFPGGSARTEYIQQLEKLGFKTSSLVYSNPVKNLVWNVVESDNYFPDQIKTPMLLIGGWYDHNVDIVMEMFDTLHSASDPAIRDLHKLLYGPWVHGGHGEALVGSRKQGELEYPEAEFWSDTMALRFFDYYLRGINNGIDQLPSVNYFQMGDNTWSASPVWPPANVKEQSWYLQPTNELKDSPPLTGGKTTYTYDPEDPSPTHGGATLKMDLKQGPYDQSQIVESRNDIAVFSTEVLNNDLVVAGKPYAEFFVSSDQRDTDFAVRLTDVYPDGRSMLLSDGILRMRYRNGFTKQDTSLIQPDTVYKIRIELPHLANTFKAGHKVRLDVSSANFPRYNRNANNGRELYPGNKDTLIDPVAAQNTVYHSQQYPSRLVLPVSSSPDAISDEVRTNTIKLMPNPAENIIYLQYALETGDGDEVLAQIYDISGQLVRSVYLQSRGVVSEIDISGLRRGYYLVRLMCGTERYSTSFVKVD